MPGQLVGFLDAAVARFERAPSGWRLVVDDDRPIFRDDLSRLLEDEGGFPVVGQASDGSEAVRLAQELRPDVLLLDLTMPRASGLDALRALSPPKGNTRVLLLTVAIEDAQVVEALRLGARGVVLKEAATELLFKAIRSVVAGQYWVGHDTVTDIVRHLRELSGNGGRTATPAERLTARERQVVAGVATGESNREIATRLGPQRDHGQAPRLEHLRQAGCFEPGRARGLRDEPGPGGVAAYQRQRHQTIARAAPRGRSTHITVRIRTVPSPYSAL